MAALYQKYRPSKFSEVIGQEHVVRTLTGAIKSGKVGHAYLFCGSRGVGKTTIARIFAKSVNCLQNKSGDACGECENCTAFNSQGALDIVEIDAASYTGVDNVREIIEQASFLPAKGKKRVYIIDEVHMLSRAAFNALLKTLEEPPEHALFILATTEGSKVPSTVLSRVQRFDFALHTAVDVKQNLLAIAKKEGVELSDEVATILASVSRGGMRDALTLLDQAIALGATSDTDVLRLSLGLVDRSEVVKTLQFVLIGDAAGLLGMVKKNEQAAVDFKYYCREAIEVSRFAFEANLAKFSLPEDLSFFSGLSLDDTAFLLRQLLRAYKEQSGSPDPALPFLLALSEVLQKFTQSHTKSSASSTPVKMNDLSGNLENKSTKPADKESVAESSVKDPVSRHAAIDAQGLNLIWAKVMRENSEENASLVALMKQAQTVKLENGVLDLVMKFDFHKKKLQGSKLQAQLIEILQKHGLDVQYFEILIDKNIDLDTQGDSVAAALQILGGEVLE